MSVGKYIQQTIEQCFHLSYFHSSYFETESVYVYIYVRQDEFIYLWTYSFEDFLKYVYLSNGPEQKLTRQTLTTINKGEDSIDKN